MSQVRALGSQGLCRTPTALAGSDKPGLDPGQGLRKEHWARWVLLGGRERAWTSVGRQHTQGWGGGGWLEDCVVHSGVLRSLEGRPTAVQGGEGKGLRTQATALLLCAFKKFTLSGLLGKNRVNLGPSLPSWGAEPWETLWGQMATPVSNGLGLEHQRTAKGARWLGDRGEETELQTHPRNKQRKPGWVLCSKGGLG